MALQPTTAWLAMRSFYTLLRLQTDTTVTITTAPTITLLRSQSLYSAYNHVTTLTIILLRLQSLYYAHNDFTALTITLLRLQ